MGLLQMMFGQAAAATASGAPRARPPVASRPRGDGTSVPPAAAMHRDLLRLALRQSLARNGIPATWIGAEALDVPGARPGVHVRLLLQHWEPRLLPYTLSFQHDLEQRLLAVEPQARDWLRGFSWQYATGPGEVGPMPDAQTWSEAAPPAAQPAPIQFEPPQAGPPRKTKEELARLFAQQDRSRAAADVQPDFAPTQPVGW